MREKLIARQGAIFFTVNVTLRVRIPLLQFNHDRRRKGLERRVACNVQLNEITRYVIWLNVRSIIYYVIFEGEYE